MTLPNLTIPMSSGLGLIIIILLIIWLLLFWRRPSTRARQWLYKSSLLGSVIGAVVIQVLHPSLLKLLSWLPNQGQWLEMIVIMGLGWGIIAAAVKMLPVDRDYPHPVIVRWQPYIGTLILFGIISWIIPLSAWSPHLILSAMFVVLAIVTMAWFPVRLLSGFIAGTLLLIIYIIVSTILASVWSELAQYWQLYQGVYLGSNWPTMIVVFCIGLSIPGLSSWWLNQPTRSVNSETTTK